MSYIRISERPHLDTCPFHQVKFVKNKHYYKCPSYFQCGFSIGSRRREGYATKMWLQQTRAGYGTMSEIVELEYEESYQKSG